MTTDQAFEKAVKERFPVLNGSQLLSCIHLVSAKEIKHVIDRTAIIYHESQPNL